MSSYYFQLVGFLPRERCNSNLTVIFISGICTTQVNTVFTVSDWLTRTGVGAIHFRAIILKFRTCLFIVTNKGILCAVVFQPVLYIIKQIITKVPVEVMDIYLHFPPGEQLLNKEQE